MVKLIPNLQILLVLLFSSLLIFLLDQINFLMLPKVALSYLTTPVQYGLYKSVQTLQNQFGFIFASRTSFKENQALKQQLGEVLSENAILRKNLEEIKIQIDQDKFLPAKTYQTTPARPIGLSRNLQIDKGARDGIKVNQPVVFRDNLLGQVKSVGEKTSSVLLTTDPDSKIASFSINKEGKAKGVIIGQFGSEILMDKILHDEKISDGDLVYSEGLGGFLPRGLILGQVTSVAKRENEIFKQAVLKPLFELKDLSLVFIITE